MLDARPVVGSRIGAIPELVSQEETGLLVSPGDAAALAAAVRRALEDSAAPGWGAEGKRRILEGSNPGAHVAGLLEIYEEAMRGGVRG
jgi:glycosyltransferase involved in cell wall biosynthesis